MTDELRAYVERDPNYRVGWTWRVEGLSLQAALDERAPYQNGHTETRWGARRSARRALTMWRRYLAGTLDPQREEIR